MGILGILDLFSNWCLSFWQTHICCQPPFSLLVFFSSISLPFLHHSLVLFDLFTRVQMSRQRERSGKGLVLSKVWMANTVLAAWRGAAWTHTSMRSRALGHTAVTSALHRSHSALSRQPCHHLQACRVCVCVCAVWRTDDWGRSSFPTITHGLVGHRVKRSLVVRGLRHPAFKRLRFSFCVGSSSSVGTTKFWNPHLHEGP